MKEIKNHLRFYTCLIILSIIFGLYIASAPKREQWSKQRSEMLFRKGMKKYQEKREAKYKEWKGMTHFERKNQLTKEELVQFQNDSTYYSLMDSLKKQSNPAR